MADAVRLFQDQKVRVLWDEDKEKWFFSVIDVITILTDQPDYQKVRNYWKWLKNKLKSEGSELVSNTNQLKMEAEDGKMRLTDVADTEQILRLIQSIPSKNAEPFKLWLAKVGNDRIDEIHDPERAINRALLTYKRKGYSDEWINQRLKTVEVRKELTDEWERVGIRVPNELAIGELTRIKEWTFFIGKTPFEDTYKIPVNIPHAHAVGLLEKVALRDVYAKTIYENDLEYVPPAYREVYRVTKNDRFEIREPRQRIRYFFLSGRAKIS